MPQPIIYDLVILLNYEHRNISSGIIVMFNRRKREGNETFLKIFPVSFSSYHYCSRFMPYIKSQHAEASLSNSVNTSLSSYTRLYGCASRTLLCKHTVCAMTGELTLTRILCDILTLQCIYGTVMSS